MGRPVMLVDDRADLRELLGAGLAAEGFEVVQSPSGEDCVRRVAAGFSGPIFLDLNMPEMNGWETIEALVDKGLADRVTVCMCTSLEFPLANVEHLAAHVKGYIVKDGDFAGIVEKMKAHLASLP